MGRDNGVGNFTEIKNNIRIRIQSKKVGGNDNAVFRLYELWLNATYSDNTPPVPTVTSVGGDTAAPWSTSNTTPMINITLNENGDCRASQLDENYSDMSNDVDCSGDGTTSISCQMGALAESASKTVYVACKDLDGNQDTVASNTHITLEIDATPPTKSGYSPASGSTINSTSQTLTFTTNEIGDCFASLDGDESYDQMSDDFDCTVGTSTSHSCSLTGLSSGANTVYIACKDDTDSSPNKDTAATNEFITMTVDTTAPTQTVTSVGGDAAAPWSTSNVTPRINITLNENGDCRASQFDESYDDMGNDVDCTGDGTTSISCLMGALAESASKTVYVACKDSVGSRDTIATNTHITMEIDTTPPTKSGYSPASGSTIASTSQTLTFTTNELGDCFASLDGDESYDQMSDDFDCTSGTSTSHSCSLTGLSEGSNTIYIACKDDTDAFPNKDTATTNEFITLTVDTNPPAPTVNTVGGDTVSTWSTSNNTPLITLTLNKVGDCRASESDESYDDMSNDVDCTGDGTTSISCPMGTLAESASKTIYVACKDALGNKDSTATNEHITIEIDATPPSKSGYSPASSSTITSTSQTLTFTTNEVGDCRASLDGDESYDQMSDDFDCTVGTSTSHSCSLSGLSEGSNTIYISCEDDTDAFPNKDNAATIKGGAAVTTTANASDADSGQTLKLFVCKTTTVNASGCAGGYEYCRNTTASVNPSCSFESESDTAEHTWYAFLFDQLNEKATSNYSGAYTTDSTAPVVTILSPTSSNYSIRTVTAVIDVGEAGPWAAYCLDNCASNVTMTNTTTTHWTATLENLTDGTHTIRFYANDSYGNTGSAQVSFLVNTTLPDTTPPVIILILPTNNTHYATRNLTLNITLDEDAFWAGFCLDACAGNTSMSGGPLFWHYNIPNISEGVHNIIFYANDSSGNMGSLAMTFTVDTTPPQYGVYSNSPLSPGDSDNVTCASLWTDNVQLAYAIVEENSSSERANHTMSLSGTSSWANYTIPSENLSLGVVECRAYANDTTGNANSTPAWTFTVRDTTPPNISNITSSRNESSEIDPGQVIVVSVNVSDNVNVTTVILQYKRINDSVWIEVPMTLINDTYSGNFTPAEGEWEYRIKAIDENGNTVYSNTTVITALYERTWTVTPNNLGGVVGTPGENTTLGTITLNNTGDVPLEFQISANASEVHFNLSSPFNVSAGSVAYIQVNATASENESTYYYEITLSANTQNASPRNASINATLVSMALGNEPLLFVRIENYSSVVTRGQTNVLLVASVKNIGNDAATGVWLAWRLPSDWSTSQSLNRSIGFMGVGETAYITVSATVSSSASIGTQTITAIAGGDGNLSAQDSLPVRVRSAGGGGDDSGGPPSTGGGGIVKPKIEPKLPTPNITIRTPDLIETIQGRNVSTSITILNEVDGTLMRQVFVTVAGFPNIVASPSWFRELNASEIQQVNLSIPVPKNADLGNHIITVTVTSKEAENSRSFILRVFEVAPTEATSCLEKSRTDVAAMRSAGFTVTYASDMLKKIEEQINHKNYGDAKRTCDEIHARMIAAFKVNTLINNAFVRITKAESEGGNASIARGFLTTAQTAFKQEDYTKAEEYANKALGAKITTPLLDITGEGILSQEISGGALILSPKTLMKVAGVFILASFALIIVLGAGYLAAQPTLSGRKIRSLSRESGEIDQMIVDLEKKRYIEKTLGAAEFAERKGRLQERKLKIAQEITTMQSKLKTKKNNNGNNVKRGLRDLE